MKTELTDEQLSSIATKIEKLLRLSKSPNEHEAALAAAKAQELLETYNLDMLTIEQHGGDRSRTKREDTKLAGGLYKWQRDIWRNVAELNFCMYWSIKGLEKGSKYEHRVLGRSTNILSTRLMAEYLEQTIERITREQYANDPKYYFSKAGIAYREGMADRISSRLQDRRHQQRREAKKTKSAAPSDSTALTVLDVEDAENDANKDFLYGEGYSARIRAASAEWRLKWERRQAEEKAEEEAFKRDHPEEWAKREADRKKAEEKASKRHRTYRYKTWEPRHASYYDGLEKGDSVSIDPQINRANRKEIE